MDVTTIFPLVTLVLVGISVALSLTAVLGIRGLVVRPASAGGSVRADLKTKVVTLDTSDALVEECLAELHALSRPSAGRLHLHDIESTVRRLHAEIKSRESKKGG